MRRLSRILIIGFCNLSFLTCNNRDVPMIKSILSPNHQIEVDFFLTSKGKPAYRVLYKDRAVIEPSTFGFDFKDADPMGEDFSIVETKTGSFNETWEMVWGEQREVVNHYNQICIELKENHAPHRHLNIYFMVFDDGLGFRFEFPAQEGFREVVIMAENTQFNLTVDHTCWWIPGDWDRLCEFPLP